MSDSLRTAGSVLIDTKAPSTGQQTYETILPDDHPGKKPRPKFEAKEQAAGRTVYHNDIILRGQLYAVFVPCVRAPAKIVSIDWAAALGMPGVVDHVDNSGAAVPFCCAFTLFLL